jgi:hypothetical protein
MTYISSEVLREGADRLHFLGKTIFEIEDWINDLPVTEEAKAAVWLYAWSLEPPARQRADALGMLRQVEADRRLVKR